jgi:outer membrane protein TolC
MRHSPKRGSTAAGRDANPALAVCWTGGVLAMLVLVLTGSIPGPASAAPPDTLEVSLTEAARRALARSPDLEAYRSQRQRARARREEATASRYLTQFQATTGHAPVPGLTESPRPNDELYLDPGLRNDWDEWVPFNQVEVEATQPLYTFGQLSGSIEAAEHGVEVEDAEVAGQAEEVALRTARLYLNVLLTEELVRLAEETGEIVERAKREIQHLLEEGDEGVDNADLFEVRLTEQEYRRRVTEVRQRRRTARSALRSQLLLPDSTVLRLTRRSIDPLAFELDSLDTYEQLALAHRSEILQARAGLAARNALLDVARSDWYPKLFLRGRARMAYTPGRERQPNPFISDPLRGHGVEAGIGFRQNLNFGQTEARVEQARAERNEVRHQQEGARRLVEVEVEDAYRNLIISRSDMRSRDTSVTISEEWLRTEQINFDLDLGDTENLVDAVRSNLEAEAAYFQAVHGYDMAVLRLLKASGVLAERLRSGRVSFED